MNWRNLMDAAKEQAGQHQPGRPKQEPLKRAVSSAYYAMFHALCRSNADTIAGTSETLLTAEAWNRIYRALNHRQAKRQLMQAQGKLPAPASAFAAVFNNLQSRRHAADYNPHGRDEVTRLLESAETVTEEYLKMSRENRRAIAALVLLQDRPRP